MTLSISRCQISHPDIQIGNVVAWWRQVRKTRRGTYLAGTIASTPMDLRLLPYAPERDVYRLLGISPQADHHEIVDACRRMARTLHPDRNRSPRANQEMQVVNAVRSLLTDRAARAEYDAARMRFATRERLSPLSVAAPLDRLPDRRTTAIALLRTGRAVMAAIMAALATLLPARCPRCQAGPGPEYRYCASCGLRLTSAAIRPMPEGDPLRP
jgi:hypothetical protein